MLLLYNNNNKLERKEKKGLFVSFFFFTFCFFSFKKWKENYLSLNKTYFLFLIFPHLHFILFFTKKLRYIFFLYSHFFFSLSRYIFSLYSHFFFSIISNLKLHNRVQEYIDFMPRENIFSSDFFFFKKNYEGEIQVYNLTPSLPSSKGYLSYIFNSNKKKLIK